MQRRACVRGWLHPYGKGPEGQPPEGKQPHGCPDGSGTSRKRFPRLLEVRSGRIKSYFNVNAAEAAGGVGQLWEYSVTSGNPNSRAALERNLTFSRSASTLPAISLSSFFAPLLTTSVAISEVRKTSGDDEGNGDKDPTYPLSRLPSLSLFSSPNSLPGWGCLICNHARKMALHDVCA